MSGAWRWRSLPRAGQRPARARFLCVGRRRAGLPPVRAQRADVPRGPRQRRDGVHRPLATAQDDRAASSSGSRSRPTDPLGRLAASSTRAARATATKAPPATRRQSLVPRLAPFGVWKEQLRSEFSCTDPADAPNFPVAVRSIRPRARFLPPKGMEDRTMTLPTSSHVSSGWPPQEPAGQGEGADPARDALEHASAVLPMVEIDKDYVFGAPGEVGLLDLFEGRRQLIVGHFMFDPKWDDGCSSCSGDADEISAGIAHPPPPARHHVRRASPRPLAKIEALPPSGAGAFPWYSSFGSDFNYDFHVTLDGRWPGGVQLPHARTSSRRSGRRTTSRAISRSRCPATAASCATATNLSHLLDFARGAE